MSQPITDTMLRAPLAQPHKPRDELSVRIDDAHLRLLTATTATARWLWAQRLTALRKQRAAE